MRMLVVGAGYAFPTGNAPEAKLPLLYIPNERVVVTRGELLIKNAPLFSPAFVLNSTIAVLVASLFFLTPANTFISSVELKSIAFVSKSSSTPSNRRYFGKPTSL